MLFNIGSVTSKKFIKYSLLVAFVTLGAITATSCTSSKNESPKKIVATFLPMYLFTKAVVGQETEIDILVPPGVDVHSYQATPKNARSLAEASILIKNGLGQEEFLEGLINSAGNSQLTEIDTSLGIEIIEEEHHDHHGEKEEEHHDHHGEKEEEHHDHRGEEEEEHHDHHGEKEEEHHDHGSQDPHIWLDPVLAQEQIKNIRDGLITVNPEDESIYYGNTETYLTKLQELDLKFRQTLAPAKGCRFITFHDAFFYLAQRYNLQQVAVVAIPEASISPKDIQKVSQTVEEFQVKAIFIEPGMNDSRVRQIAQDFELTVGTLDPITSGNTDPDYYLQIMEQNLESLKKACL